MDSQPRRKILTLSIVLLISCIYVHKRFFYSEQKNILAYASKRTLITHRCRSLFTIDESVIQALLYQASNNTNENNYSSTRKGGEGHYHEVSTDKYTLLASFLPVALKMKMVNLSTGGYLEKENAEESPILLRQRRIDNAGAFPLANCAIASYSDKWQYSSCIKKWIELAGSLRIYFMGDSKVRYLFNEFLQQTNEEYNYTIKVADRNGSFELFQTVKERAKTIQEAITDKDPNFRIKFSFNSFIMMKKSKVNALPEIIQLRKWASGSEDPPHLLIVGYGLWSFQALLNSHTGIHEALDALHMMHHIVIPLLEKISKRSKVLVMPPSRTKLIPSTFVRVRQSAYSDPFLDWGDMSFLYELEQFRNQNLNSKMHSDWEEEEQDEIGHVESDTMTFTSSSGLLWWDSSLPLQLAERIECEELYKRFLLAHPIYLSSELNCFDYIHSGRIALRDMTTMLFNLLCNSIMEAGEMYCC